MMSERSSGALAGVEERFVCPDIERTAAIRESTEANVDLAIAACDGEPRAAIRALIILVAHLEEELNRARQDTSRGCVRGRYGAPR